LPSRVPSPARCCAFFVSASAPPRALHSFPTRRSSDLTDSLLPEMPLPAPEREGNGSDGLPPRERTVRERPLKRLRIRQKGCIVRSEEHTSELQSRFDLVCRLLLEKKNMKERGTRLDGT